jgi:hypothetical protein
MMTDLKINLSDLTKEIKQEDNKKETKSFEIFTLAFF